MEKIIITIGIYNFELKNFKMVSGHDDSLPFEGNLYANGKRIARCFNDGWGADAVVYADAANKTLFNKVTDYLKDKKFDGFSAELSYIADSLACKKADYVEAQKLMKRGVVFRNQYGGYTMIPLVDKNKKEIPTAKLMATQDGRDAIKRLIEKYTKLGYVCVSTNIG